MIFESISLEGIAATLALVISIFAYLKSKEHNQQVIKAETLMHFTKAYQEFVEADNRPMSEKVQDDTWISGYWGLQGSEFYFFHRGTIPPKMYTIWMTDVVDMYSRFPQAWHIHKKYLSNYGKIYDEMENFFDRIYDYSKIKDDERRYKELEEFISNWIEKNETKF